MYGGGLSFGMELGGHEWSKVQKREREEEMGVVVLVLVGRWERARG